MLMVTLPKTVQFGETVETRIDGELRRVTREAGFLVIEPGDFRRIITVVDEGDLQTFICADDAG